MKFGSAQESGVFYLSTNLAKLRLFCKFYRYVMFIEMKYNIKLLFLNKQLRCY